MAEVPLDLLDRIRTIEDQLRQLQGRANIRPALNQILSGAVTVGQGGTFQVNNLSGGAEFYVGGIAPAHPDGSPQRGLIAWREDGSQAIALYSPDANPQRIVMNDAAGNTIFAEDSIAHGLAIPYIAADGWFGATEVPTFTTSGGTFTTVTHLPFVKQHPKVTAWYLVRCSDGSTSGEIRLVDDSGVQIGPTVTIGLGGFTYGSIAGALNGAHLSQTYLHWQARTTAGAGTIGVKGLSTYGVQS